MISYALAAVLLYVLPLSIADIISKKSILRIGARSTGTLMIAIGIIPALIFAYFLGLGTFSAYSASMAALAGIMASIGYAMFYKSIETEQISNSMAFLELAAAIFVIFGFFVFGEAISAAGLLGVAVVFIGATLISITEERKFNKGLVPAMAAFIFWSLGFIIFSYSISSAGAVGMPLIIGRLATLAAFAFISAFIGFKKGRTRKHGFKTVAVIGALDATGIAAFGIVSVLHYVGIAGIVNAFVPIMAAIVGYAFFKERLSRVQLLGFAIMIAGGIMISLF